MQNQPSEKRCQVKVLVFAASLRRDSYNKRLATLAAKVVEEQGGTVDHASMTDFDCPPYDGDVEVSTGIPANAQRFRDRLEAVDAFIISSPEYNASMPGFLKNAIDWVSRFRPQPFNGRQGLLISASPAMGGGNRGLWALRVPLEHLGGRIYPDMFSLAQAHTAFTDAGRIIDATLQKRFDESIGCFLDLVEAARHYRPLKKLWVENLGERPDPVVDRVEEAEVAPVS